MHIEYTFIRVQIFDCSQSLKAATTVPNHKENLFLFSICDKISNCNLLNVNCPDCDPSRLDTTSVLQIKK